MLPRLMVWDWNGTLLDDAALGCAILNEMLGRRGLATISMERYREVFRFPIEEYYRECGFCFEQEPYDDLAKEYWVLYQQQVTTAPLVRGAQQTLGALQALGLSHTILSASEQGHLQQIVRARGLAPYFEDIIGLRGIHAKSKLEAAKVWMQSHGLCGEQLLLVGDTTHDVETAQALGCQALLVDWGHCSHARLAATGMPVCSSMAELFAMCWEIMKQEG